MGCSSKRFRTCTYIRGRIHIARACLKFLPLQKLVRGRSTILYPSHERQRTHLCNRSYRARSLPPHTKTCGQTLRKGNEILDEWQQTKICTYEYSYHSWFCYISSATLPVRQPPKRPEFELQKKEINPQNSTMKHESAIQNQRQAGFFLVQNNTEWDIDPLYGKSDMVLPCNLGPDA